MILADNKWVNFSWTFLEKQLYILCELSPQETNHMSDFLILKVPGKQAADDIQKYFLYYFSREKVWHFMWNICLPVANVRICIIQKVLFSLKNKNKLEKVL